MLRFPFDMFFSPEFLSLSLQRKVPHCLPSRYGYPCILMLPHQKPCPLLVCPHPGPDLCPLQITHTITWSSHLCLCSTTSSLNSARPELHPLQPASLCLSSWQQAMWQMKASKEGCPPLGLSFFVFVFCFLKTMHHSLYFIYWTNIIEHLLCAKQRTFSQLRMQQWMRKGRSLLAIALCSCRVQVEGKRD